MTHLHDRAVLISARGEPLAPADAFLSRDTAPGEPVRFACSPPSIPSPIAAGFVQEPSRMARGIIVALVLSAALWAAIALAAWLLLRG